MLPYRKFNGELNGKRIHDFIKELDFNTTNIEERIKKLDEIVNDEFFIEYFDNYFKVNLNTDDPLSDKDEVCHELEKMANYILFSPENLKYNDECEYPILSENRLRRIRKKEVSLDELEEKEKKDLEFNFKKYPKMKITKKDLETIPEIKAIQDTIDFIKKNRLSDEKYRSKKYQYAQICKELRQYQIEIKRSTLRPIEFKRLGWETTIMNYDGDTGYIDENGNYKLVSENYINFGDPKHIRYLLKFYSSLKQDTWDDLNGDMKYILYVLEYLIDKTELKDYEKDVIIWYIDGYKQIEIINMIYDKYGLEWNSNYLSRVLNQIIPKKIANTFWDDFEEWFYTFKAKGVYKTCSKCGQNKLANEKYFRKNQNSPDKLYSVCRECEVKNKK